MKWEEATADQRKGFCMVVDGLSAKVLIGVERSPEALRVFMAWMGGESDKIPG